MPQPRPHVARPRILSAALAALTLATTLAVLGFVNIAVRAMNAPSTILGGADRLEAALERAPWTSAGREGPVVWAVIGAPCDTCAEFAVEDLAALERDGYDVRLIFVAAPESALDEQARAIAQARARRGAEGLPEPGEDEGDLAWGQSVKAEIDAVIRENQGISGLPILVWRRGPEWRLKVGRDPHLRQRLETDLGPRA